jgi:hypothetical protein
VKQGPIRAIIVMAKAKVAYKKQRIAMTGSRSIGRRKIEISIYIMFMY